ncbi:conserved Plasmodium protein, unknown function [Plasmodium sp. gorilla clade G3]|nr:conserved Plasmodium protein, unknown function [Plasmodium sp. gorilla clade G3]
MKGEKEDVEFRDLVTRYQNYSIYDELNKNTIDKNIIKKISILYDIFKHINKVRNNNTNDFIYTSDIIYCLRYDNFVRIRFHITSIERKKINNLDKNNYNFIENLNNIISNIYNPSYYDKFLNNNIICDKEKFNIMLKYIREIENAYIYKYRSDHNIKLTFDVFSHSFYIFLSYDYKKKLSIKNFKNKYNQIKNDNIYEYTPAQKMLQFNSLGTVLTTTLVDQTNHKHSTYNYNSFEHETLERIAPFIYESENMIMHLHRNKIYPIKNLEIENDFFIKNKNYENNMTNLIKLEKIKDEHKRLKKNIQNNFSF